MDVRVRSLKRAAEIVGGDAQLALQLGVTPDRLSHWIDGVTPLPTYIFFRVVDLIAAHDISTMKVASGDASESRSSQHSTIREPIPKDAEPKR